MKSYFSTMMYRHDCVFGLINSPYNDYPLNTTGLLHAVDDVLVYSTDNTERIKALKIRKDCVKLLN